MGPGVLRRPFPRIDGVLHAGNTPLDSLAKRFGTPLYVYDAETIRSRYRALVRAFGGVDLLVAYSVKANGSLAILDVLGRLGAGADIVSGGELFRARRAGIPANRIVFAGVGKTESEIQTALAEGILSFHVESRSELVRLERLAARVGLVARFGVRVNPDIESPTPHEYTRTGHAASKFGIPASEVLELYAWARTRPALDPTGIDVHIGSQIVTTEPYVRALSQVLGLVDALGEQGTTLDYIDLGGGFGVEYGDSPQEMPIQELADIVTPEVQSRGLRLVIEPGRYLVGDAGVLVTRVEGVKQTGKTFVVTDAGMSELLRPSHYGGEHVIESVRPAHGEPTRLDVVGPICETGDFLARDRWMPMPEQGDLLAVRTAGAYGFAMASNYNARPRPAEVMVDADQVHLIREREQVHDLIRGEHIPDRPKQE